MKEFKLIVAKEIKAFDIVESGVVMHKIGDVIIVEESRFDEIKGGKKVKLSQIAGHGYYTTYYYDKHNFENEVEEIEIVINRKVRKLGIRKN
jgi:hypothetical protein